MIETTLTTDSFNKNVIIEDDHAKIRQVYHLVTMKPGTDPLNPDKGCDLNRFYYWFVDEVNIPVEEQKIKQQIEKYTDYQGVTVKLKVTKRGQKNILNVLISADGGQTMLISSNGLYSEYTDLRELPYNFYEEMNKTINTVE